MYHYDINTETARTIANKVVEGLFSIDRNELPQDTLMDLMIFTLFSDALAGDKSAIMALFSLATDPTASNECDSDKDCHCFDEDEEGEDEEIYEDGPPTIFKTSTIGGGIKTSYLDLDLDFGDNGESVDVEDDL
jgi:hypothetical protein